MQGSPHRDTIREWWQTTVVPWWYNVVVPWWYSLDWSDEHTWYQAAIVLSTVALWLWVFYLLFRLRKQVHINRREKHLAVQAGAASLRAAVEKTKETYRSIQDECSKQQSKKEDEAIDKIAGALVDAFVNVAQESTSGVERAYNTAMEKVEQAHVILAERLDSVYTTMADKMQEQCESTVAAVLKSQKRSLEVVRDVMKILDGATPEKVYEMTSSLKDLDESHNKVLDQLEELQEAVAKKPTKDDEDDE